MNYFAQVTDSALRRIYKFVLKRLIGKYLREELVLEQLVVNSRKGTIEIDLLNFDVDILNEEYFSAFPLKLVELSVSNINVSLSYLNILSESCVITVDQIRLTLTDNSESVRPASPQRRPPETRQDFQSGESHVDDISLAEEGESGLAFVAHWIETIINQLQVQINTLVLNLSNESNGIELELKASNIHFHNGDFKEFSEGGVSSSQFASSLMRDSLLKSRFFCKSKKTINVDKVRVAARKRNDCRESEVLRCDPFKIFILSEKNKKDNLVLTDFDVKFSSGTIWFDAEALGLIIQFFTSFKPDEIDTTHAHVDSRTTQTMEGEMDHNDVLISEEIEKLYLEPTSIPHLPSMEEVVESDGEFPDGNDTEEDFFDAVSHVQMNTTLYRTARPLSINERLSKKEPALKFRVYCCALTVHVVNESKEALVLKFNDFIVMKSDEAENINLLKISVNQVFVNLIRKNEEIDIVKFLPEEDNGNTIFSSPDLIIEINLITVEVAILLKSFEVFIDLECFKNWMNWTKLINTSLKKTGGQSKSSSSLSLQTKFCRFYLNCLTSNAEVDVNDFISISLGSKFWDQGSCTLRVRQAMGFFIDMEGLKLIVNDDTRDLTCSLETPHLSAGAFSISTPGSVKIAMVLQCFAASLTPLITLRESQFDSKTYIILSASKIEIALHKVYFAVINWLVSALIFARPSHQADSAGQTSFEARITEFLIFLGNHDQFNLLNLQLFNSDYNDIVKGFSKDALNIRWGPDLVIDGNDLCLRAVVSQNKTQVEASSKHLRAKESIGPSHEKFHDFLQAKSEKSDSIAIYVTLNQADTQSLLSSDSNVRIVLSDSQFYLNCSSQLLLILSEFSPLKAQDMLDRFYYELKQSCDCDLKHSLNVVVSKGKVAGNLCEMESGKVCIDALKVYVELSNFHLFLLDNSMTGSSKIHAQRFTVLVTQLSNSKAFSLKCSSENVAISHQTNELKNFELLKVDFFSILINSLDDGGKSGKEWIEAKFGNLEGRNSVKDLLLIQDYLQSFISNYSKTVAEVILTRKSFEISSKGEPDAWSELFAGDQVDEASSFRNKVASPSPQINSYITEENDEPSVNESVLGSLWEADYGSYGEPLSEPVNNPIECIPLRDKETDSILDALTNSLTDDYPNLDFSNNEEIELSSIRAENEILIEKVQPGLTETELAEIEEVDFAWRDDDSVERNDLSSNPLKASKERDQQATWLIDPETVEINNFYLHNENSTKSGINFVHGKYVTSDCQNFPFYQNLIFQRLWILEENLSFGLRISGNCKYTIMDSGVSQFAKENRIALKNPSDHSQSPTKEEIEISFSGVVIELAHFSTSSRTVEELSRTNLISKLQFTVQNLLVTHRTGSRLKNYKVLGSWNNANHPKGSEDLLKMTILGFSSEHLKLEHRVKIILSPVRCHLTEQFISFIKDKIVTTISDHFQSSDSDVQPVIFFQHIFVASMEIKIDYHANNVNIKALHEGDYIQLLNIFPLEGLELHLKTIRLLGVNGISSLVDSILQVWVTDIYKNQLHRVLTGTVPFRSLSRIGSSLKGLLFIPLRDNQRNPKVWKQLVKGTKSLLSTVTTEALSISHQLSLFVANTISDIASERNYSEITTNQPRNLREGFDRAVHSFSNELSSSIEHVIAVPIRQYQRNGSTGAMTSVIRALPVALLRPVAGVAHGLSYTILGLRNSLNPMQAMDEEDLWESVEQQNP